MNIQLLAVPYDSGHKSKRMGCGPMQFTASGIDRLLAEAGHDARLDLIEVDDPFPTEVGTTFRLHRQVSERVGHARQEGRLPIVMAGNCGLASIGTVAALSDAPTGIIWFDAHGDFNTPDTTGSGFLDGMALAVITGRCWKALAASIPGFQPVPENRVCHAGGRDLDPVEHELMQSSDMCVLTPERIAHVGIAEALKPALDYISPHVERVYLHIDMDILNAEEAPANHYAALAPGGLSVADVLSAIRQIGERLPIAGAGVASYDPAADPDGKALRAGVSIMQAVAESAQAGV